MRILKILFGLLAAAGLVAAIWVFFVLSSVDGLVKTSVEAVGTAVLSTEVRVAETDFDLEQGRGQLTGLVIKNPYTFSDANFMSLSRVAVLIKPDSIEETLCVIEELTLDGGLLMIEHVGLDKTNVLALLDNVKAMAQAEVAEAFKIADHKRFQVNHLNIINTKMQIVSPQVAPKTVDLGEIRLQGIGDSEQGLSAEQLAAAVLEPLLEEAQRAFLKELAL